MQLYFIRHAQSSNNALYDTTGSWSGRSSDPELTETGVRQAERLGQFLRQGRANGTFDPQNAAGFGLSHLYASPMIRALHTGFIVAETVGLPLTPWEDAHEVGGVFQDGEESNTQIGQPGLTRAEMTARFPGLHVPEDRYASGWWHRPFETDEQRPPRARRFLDDMTARHGGTADRVAVISHGGFFHLFMTTLLDMRDGQGFWFLMNNAGITRIDFNDDHILLAYLNRLDFLPRDLIT